jgi:septal ring factor EnvC (AmiA/AmiB activator)
MANNHLADISTFESLQSEQHSRTGIDQMSMFNNHKNKDIAITNIDSRELIVLLGDLNVLKTTGKSYKALIKENKTDEAKTLKDKTKANITNITQKITKLEKEIEQDKQQIQSLKNDLKDAQKEFE